MGITVVPAEDKDMVRLFTITSLAFKDNEPFWDAMYHDHHTDEGRRKGGARFVKAKHSDPNTTFVKAVDDSTGEIAGFAKWNVFKNFIPKAGRTEGDYWQTIGTSACNSTSPTSSRYVRGSGLSTSIPASSTRESSPGTESTAGRHLSRSSR